MPTQSYAVTIPRTEIRPLPSAIVDQIYRLHVALPPAYDSADRRYPVVYASPAFPDFFFLWPIIHAMLVSEQLPPLILVGIGYGLDDPRAIVLRRLRDHMPTPDQQMDREIVEWAGTEPDDIARAGDFLRFIREELQPFVDGRYRTRPSEHCGYANSDHMQAVQGLQFCRQKPDLIRPLDFASRPARRRARYSSGASAQIVMSATDLRSSLLPPAPMRTSPKEPISSRSRANSDSSAAAAAKVSIAP